MDTQTYIKETGLSTEEIIMLREQVVEKYCKQQGWDKSKLTTEQIFEIHSSKEWKTPGLING